MEYKTELGGVCGVNMKVVVWAAGFSLECPRCGFKEEYQRSIKIPYYTEVLDRCAGCDHRDEKD